MPESPEELDLAVRLAAFTFLEDRLFEGTEETLSFDVLRKGFTFRGERVPLLGPQGIFKPAVLPEVPLTIATAPPKKGKPAPYDDVPGPDGTLLYRYRGTDPMHHENVGLRKAIARKVPLIYLRGIVTGRYLPEWPVYVVGDDPTHLTFQVSIDDHAVFAAGSLFGDEGADARRAYVTVQARQRLHQARFRERVLRAYRECCAICRLRHRELLDATHILPDRHPLGEPVVSNGLSLCKLHHAAYDRHIMGIRPDCRIHVRLDILEEVDGPMLLHGLQGFQDKSLIMPRQSKDHPNRDYLAERYEQFLRAS